MSEPEGGEKKEPELTDADIEGMKQQRFQQRVQRVLAVMEEQRIDWRGQAFVTPDGRIGVGVVPVEMQREVSSALSSAVAGRDGGG